MKRILYKLLYMFAGMVLMLSIAQLLVGKSGWLACMVSFGLFYLAQCFDHAAKAPPR